MSGSVFSCLRFPPRECQPGPQQAFQRKDENGLFWRSLHDWAWRVLRLGGELSEDPVAVGKANALEPILCLFLEHYPRLFAVIEFLSQDVESKKGPVNIFERGFLSSCFNVKPHGLELSFHMCI